MKPIYDSEFPIIDFTEGIGKDKNAIIWVCNFTRNIANNSANTSNLKNTKNKEGSYK